jgi:hypothetical protein
VHVARGGRYWDMPPAASAYADGLRSCSSCGQGVWYKDCEAATVCYDQPHKQAMDTCMRGTCACRPFTCDSPLRNRQPSLRNKDTGR